MTVWSAVYLYGGIISDIQVFATLEDAREYFHKIINDNGSVDDCDPDYYEDGKNGNFYWYDGCDNEIAIWQTKLKQNS